jgi:hypothetical protein
VAKTLVVKLKDIVKNLLHLLKVLFGRVKNTNKSAWMVAKGINYQAVF